MEVKPFVVVTVLALVCLTLEASAYQAQAGNSIFELPLESSLSKLFKANYNDNFWGANERVKRSMKEDIEKGFKDFSEKVAKLPDQLNGSLKKFFEERGISMESIQKILNEIYKAVEKLINEVKKAM